MGEGVGKFLSQKEKKLIAPLTRERTSDGKEISKGKKLGKSSPPTHDGFRIKGKSFGERGKKK